MTRKEKMLKVIKEYRAEYYVPGETKWFELCPGIILIFYNKNGHGDLYYDMKKFEPKHPERFGDRSIAGYGALGKTTVRVLSVGSLNGGNLHLAQYIAENELQRVKIRWHKKPRPIKIPPDPPA